jgi:DNA-binding NarL/FixJ family response regulator
VIVLDISLPGASGFELAAQLARAGSRARIVFLTVHNDPDSVRAAFESGASAYVVKMRLALDVVPALQAVVEGGSFTSPDCR